MYAVFMKRTLKQNSWAIQITKCRFLKLALLISDFFSNSITILLSNKWPRYFDTLYFEFDFSTSAETTKACQWLTIR